MRSYELPNQLDEDIKHLEELLIKYEKGEIQATELKAHRVPFGIYEQREPDTYMMRIRCAGGVISPLQLEKVSFIAKQYNINDIHITSRQELQFHYVKLENIIAMIRQLKEAGLATRGGGGNTVRNIIAEEDAGIDPEEAFDVTPYALALTTRFIAENDSWSLPRKFKIAFSGSVKDKGYATIADVGFIAKVQGGKKGFTVYAAGGLGAKPAEGKLLLDFINDDEVYQAAKAIKNIFWKYGNRKNKHAARLRFLWRDLGEDEFKKRFQEEYKKIKQEGLPPLDIKISEGPSTVSKLGEEEPRDQNLFNLWKTRFVRLQKQSGFASVIIPVELGFISNEEAMKLSKFLAQIGDDVLRMTKDQNFMLRNIPARYLGNVYNFLTDTFKDAGRPPIYGSILSCAGASTCQLGICLSRQAAKAIMRALEKSGLDLDKAGRLRLNISGCPNSCGQHPVADLGFFGKASRKDGRLYPAYNVVAGAIIEDGKTRLAEQVGEIAAKDMPMFVKDFLAGYLSKSSKYKNIKDYIAGKGREDLKQLCGRYKDIPGFGEDKNYYFDWGADNVFSMSERRAGECSAGLFDLIEMDLKNIKETRNKLKSGSETQDKIKQLLKELVFYSSRMLLITRGVESTTENEAYELFLKYFVDTGLVASSFKAVITSAGKGDYQKLLDNEDLVHKFAETVELLYENMDNAFNFKGSDKIEAVKQEAAGIAAVTVKDLRGVACPMNFVKTKVELAKLKHGERLEVWLDDGPPIENVPGSVKAEGHTIIQQKKKDNYWTVLIEKK